jgi:hypothetical protein
MGRRYLRFAIEHPGLLTLTLRGEQLDTTSPALQAAMARSRAAFEQAVSARTSGAPDVAPLVRTGRMMASWALVHGFTTLMLERRLNGVLASLPGTSVEALFEVMLNSIAYRGVGDIGREPTPPASQEPP